MKKRLVAFLLVLIMVLGMLPVSAMAASNSTVVLHPSVNSTVTGVKVKVGDTISGHTVSTISGYDITVDLGKYNVNNDTFRLPYAKDIWEGVDNNKVDYISWAGSGSNSKSEGASALLANGKNTAYYYFKGATPTPTYMYYLYYKYNDGTDSTWLTDVTDRPTAATTFTFNVNRAKLTRSGYDHIGWADKADAVTAQYTGGDPIVLTKDNPTKTIYAVWMPFFELKYDANGGTGAPASQTHTASAPTVNRVTFTVPGTIPTKDGCTFKGWADSATATDAQYQPGDKVAVKHENSPKTVYAVWQSNTPPTDKPAKPTENDVTGVVVDIVCVTTTGTHDTVQYPLGYPTDAQHTIGEVVSDGAGGYICPVTVRTAWFVQQASNLRWRVQHTPTAQTITFNLTYDKTNKKWVKPAANPRIEATHEVTPDMPGDQKPNIEEANAKIRVQCIEYPSKHNPYKQNYRILPGSYEDLGWDQTEYGYIYSIRLNRAKYIAQFDQEIGRPHTDTEPNKETRINWRWENGAWHLNGGPDGIDADIKVKCDQTETPPTKPIITGRQEYIRVICKNEPNKERNYVPKFGRYTESDPAVQKVNGVWTYTITILRDKHVEEFNKDFPGHEDTDPNAVTTMSWVWKDAEWKLVPVNGLRTVGAIIEVTCKPKAPTADELKKLDMAVQVKCVVDAAQQHTDAYGLLGEYDEDYFVGEPRKDGDDWLCDISYDPNLYVAEFNTTFQNLKHVQNDEKIVPVTLIWAGDSWQLKTQGRVHVTEVYTVTYTDGVDGEEVFADQVYSDLRKDSTTPAFNGTPTRTGYTFAGWEPEVAATVTQTVTYVAKWEKKTYKVVAKLYVNGKPAYYQNEDFYTYEVSGLYGEAIDFDTIKAKAVEQAKQIKKASASYTAVILEDHEPNPVCTTFGEHQPGQATHYVKVNVKTEENVVIFQSFEGKTDLTKLHTTTAPYGTNVVEFLNGLGLDLDVAGYTLDTAEDGNTNWYKKDSPKWTFGANDTINGWTNVLLKYTITPHNIYAYLRTGDSIGDVLELNEATLNRLGLTKYNTEGFISIGTFVSNTLLTQDEYYGFDEDEAFLDVLAELQTKLVPETGVSLDKVGSKINWSWLYQPSDVDDRIAGYPTEDTDGYQLSGSLLLYGAKFEAGANDVTGMPTAAYGAYLDYFVSGESFNLPAAPTRPGYDFKGWKIGNAVLTAGAAYTVDEDDMVFTAQWEARTDTPYTVEHYLEKLDGSYALDTTEPLKGTTDTTVTAAAKSYDNFTYDSTVPGTVASGNIAGDGSLVLKLFYTRNTYDYTVRHIKQLPDGSYDEANAEVETLSGKFEALAAVTAKDYGEHYPTNDADTKQNIKIEKGLTIDVKYDLDEHTLTFETNGGSAINPVTVRHGNAVARPADPTKDKYTFIGWYADPEFTEEYDFATVLEADKTIYAKFELTSTPIGDIYVRYDVLHIKQLPDGTYDLANAEVEHLSAKKDTTVTAVIKDYRATHHVNVNRTLSKLTGTAIQPYMGVDGKPVYTILSVYYDLDFHTLTFDTMGGSKIAPETVRHGLTVAKPKDPVNGGYIFDGWYTDKTFRHRYDFSTPLTEDITIYAKWFLIVLPGVTVKKNTPKLNTADHFAYVQGYPDGTVKPAGNITRAETAAILFRLMDDASRKTYYSTKSGFRDVASGSWYNTYVATLNNAGVITDSSNGYFRPNEAITRAELAAMLAKFSETTSAANYFNDVSAKYWAANAIAICAKLGWITGYPDGTFRPDKNVTRAELMAMINRATGRAPKSADAFLPGMKTWIDNTSDKWYYLDVQEATNSHSYTVKGSETWTALTSDPNWSLYE